MLPQFREYERFSTTALNAYVAPSVRDYVSNLADRLRQAGVQDELQLMNSAGGVLSAEGARELPVSLLMSGPVAGVLGGIWAGRLAGADSVITIDMGGTSVDIGVAPEGQFRMKHILDSNVGGYHTMMPTAECDTVGAGGGSIAFIDEGGVLRVGPRSAGADPGPACYGWGGTEPTVTDAEVVLGRSRPDALLAGSLPLEPDLAEQARSNPRRRSARTVGGGGRARDARDRDRDHHGGHRDEQRAQGARPARLRARGVRRCRPAVRFEIAARLNIPSVIVPPTRGSPRHSGS